MTLGEKRFLLITVMKEIKPGIWSSNTVSRHSQHWLKNKHLRLEKKIGSIQNFHIKHFT